MSRSNPNDNSPNPSTRWFQWNGSSGVIEYYDKEAKEMVEVGDKFTFILLDQLAVVKGWHDGSDSGITSNEVKDVRAESMVVKAFKGGILAEGFYATIRDRIKSVGGHFCASMYIMYRDERKNPQLGNLQFKGAALNAWVEFSKLHRSKILEQAISIIGSTEGKKGKITFKFPRFALKDITDETNAAALKMDAELLQPYLKAYFGRTRTQQVETPAPTADSASEPPLEEPAGETAALEGHPEYVDSVPF